VYICMCLSVFIALSEGASRRSKTLSFEKENTPTKKKARVCGGKKLCIVLRVAHIALVYLVGMNTHRPWPFIIKLKKQREGGGR